MKILVWQAFMLGLSAWLILSSLASVANARIKMPQIVELIDSADLIVIGKVESVLATPPELGRQNKKGDITDFGKLENR